MSKTGLQKPNRSVERFTVTREAFSLLFQPMAAKYYTHFLTAAAAPKRAPDSSEWSGVVELRSPLESSGGTKELRSLLAQSFDLDSEDIKILHWARLH
jgi:hypothetical protein